jgi:error-prone DNA polymerase
MMAINGRIKRDGDMVHLVAQQLFDLSTDLSSIAEREGALRPPAGRGDEFAHGSPESPDSRERPAPGLRARAGSSYRYKIKSRNFQ